MTFPILAGGAARHAINQSLRFRAANGARLARNFA